MGWAECKSCHGAGSVPVSRKASTTDAEGNTETTTVVRQEECKACKGVGSVPDNEGMS